MTAKRLAIAVIGAGMTLALPGAAAADNGYSTADVNMRAGPSTRYPVVTTIPEGRSVMIYGCLSSWDWCDIDWRGNRGWVFSDYLNYDYRNRRVPVPEFRGRLDLPMIQFSFGNYWDRHYRGRPWYDNRDRWYDGDRHQSRDRDRSDRDNRDHRDSGDNRDNRDNRWNNDRNGRDHDFGDWRRNNDRRFGDDRDNRWNNDRTDDRDRSDRTDDRDRNRNRDQADDHDRGRNNDRADDNDRGRPDWRDNDGRGNDDRHADDRDRNRGRDHNDRGRGRDDEHGDRRHERDNNRDCVPVLDPDCSLSDVIR